MTEENKTYSVDEFLALGAARTEEARTSCNKYIEEHFGVYGTEDFKAAEYEAFKDECMAEQKSREATQVTSDEAKS